MPAKSYGFAIGNVRAIENSLLKNTDLVRLTSAKNIDELSNILRDRGYGGGFIADNVPDMLKEENSKLWKYLLEIAPEVSFFEPFLYENDFHNLKVILKGIIRNKTYDNLLILPSLVDFTVIETAVKEKQFDRLPVYMREPARQAYDKLIKEGNAQLSDGIIDAGCMTAQLNTANNTGNKIITQIIKATVFYNSFKVAIRAAKTGKTENFLDYTLIDTDFLNKKVLKNSVLNGVDKVLELMSSYTEFQGEQAAESFKISPSNFEKFYDDYIMNIAKKCKYVTIGIEPIIGYMLAKTAEIKTVRIIYSGIKTGQSDEKIQGRLRGLYA